MQVVLFLRLQLEGQNEDENAADNSHGLESRLLLQNYNAGL
jgi:hypothetical protein